MKVSGITVKNLTDYLKLDYQSPSEEILELATFLKAAQSFISDYTDLTHTQIDSHETFVVAVYVLVQDMYDNSSFYVDKSNLNRVVEMILVMYSVNLF